MNRRFAAATGLLAALLLVTWTLTPEPPAPPSEVARQPLAVTAVDGTAPIRTVERAEQPIAVAAPEPEIRTMRVELLPVASEPVRVRVSRSHEELVWYRSTFDAEAGGRVRGPDGVEVGVQPNALVDASGQPVVGEASVRWTYVDGVDKVVASPGALATQLGGLRVPIQSFGMVRVDFEAAGEPVDLVVDADLSFPIVEGVGNAEGASVYRYDESTGLWTDEGAGELTTERFALRMRNAGWWNCDRPLAERGCVRGTLASDGWDLPEDTRAHLVGTSYMTRDVATPDDDGGFCLDGMPGVQARIEAYQVGPQCFALQSELVSASEAGTSCFTDVERCVDVTLTPVPIACADAQANLALMGERIQIAAADIDLRRGVRKGPLRLSVPPEVREVALSCNHSTERVVARDGRVDFEAVSITEPCKMMLTDATNTWVLDDALGGRNYDCGYKRGRGVVCNEQMEL